MICSHFSKSLILGSIFGTELMKLSHLVRIKCFFASRWTGSYSPLPYLIQNLTRNRINFRFFPNFIKTSHDTSYISNISNWCVSGKHLQTMPKLCKFLQKRFHHHVFRLFLDKKTVQFDVVRA